MKLSKLQQQILDKEPIGIPEDKVMDVAYESIKKMLGDGDIAVSKTRFDLTKVEETSMQYTIAECIRAGDDPDQIANNIIAVIKDKLQELKDDNEEAKVQGGGMQKKSPIFRRSKG